MQVLYSKILPVFLFEYEDVFFYYHCITAHSPVLGSEPICAFGEFLIAL